MAISEEALVKHVKNIN